MREAKLSRNKKIKVCFFPGAKTEDLQYHLILYPKKKLNNIIIHIGTNDSPYKSEDLIYKEFLYVKQTIHKQHPDCKNIMSFPIIQTDKQEANSILKKYNSILKQEEKKVISQQHYAITFEQGWPTLKF